MNIITKGLATGILLVATVPVTASEDGNFFDKSMEWLTTDTYVGIQLGTASADVDEAGLASKLDTATTINSISLDDGGTGYRLYFGKKFTDHLSGEIGFADLGDIDVDVNANALDPAAYYQQLANFAPVAPAGIVIDAVGDWSFADMGAEGDWAGKTSLFGRLGLFMWETEIDYGYAGNTYGYSDDGVDLHIGIGAAYQINDNLDVRFEYEMYQSTTEASMIGLGVRYSF